MGVKQDFKTLIDLISSRQKQHNIFEMLKPWIPRSCLSGGASSTTIFGPTDSYLLTCPSFSVPLLQEHCVPGLYPVNFLCRLAFGMKIETLAANRCLTVTETSADATAGKVFINSVEIRQAQIFVNMRLTVRRIGLRQ